MQTPGPLVLRLSSKAVVSRHLSIAQVLSQLCLPVFKTLFWEDDLLPYLACRGTSHGQHHHYSGKSEDLVLMITERQTYRQRDRDIIQTCFSIVKSFTFIFAFLFSCV